MINQEFGFDLPKSFSESITTIIRDSILLILISTNNFFPIFHVIRIDWGIWELSGAFQTYWKALVLNGLWLAENSISIESIEWLPATQFSMIWKKEKFNKFNFFQSEMSEKSTNFEKFYWFIRVSWRGSKCGYLCANFIWFLDSHYFLQSKKIFRFQTAGSGWLNECFHISKHDFFIFTFDFIISINSGLTFLEFDHKLHNKSKMIQKINFNSKIEYFTIRILLAVAFLYLIW